MNNKEENKTLPEGWRLVRLGDLFNQQLMIEKGKMLTKKQMTLGDYLIVAGGRTYATSQRG